MKRYYITRILGIGVHDDPYYSELRVYIQENWPDEPHFIKQVIHANVISWAIMAYDLSDLAHADVIANVTGIFSFPSGSLDITVGDINPDKRLEIRDKLESVGFEFTWATSSTTVRQILKYVCRSIQLASWGGFPISAANFNLNTTVADIPVNVRLRIADKLTDLGIDFSWITGTTTIGEIAHKIQRRSDNSVRLFGVVKRNQWLFQDFD